MKKIILGLTLLFLLFPAFRVHGAEERWELILPTDYFSYYFDKLSLKYTIDPRSETECLDVWLKYQYTDKGVAELVTLVKQRNLPAELVEYTESLDYMLIHTLLSKTSGKLELENIAFDKSGNQMKLDTSPGEWLAIVPGSINEYLFTKVWECAAGEAKLTKSSI